MHIRSLACTGNSKRPKRYIPWAEGPRSCVGKNLANVSLMATTATLLQHFRFRLADNVRTSNSSYPQSKSLSVYTW